MPTIQNTTVEGGRRWGPTIVVLSLWLSLFNVRSQSATDSTPILTADLNGARSVSVFSGWPILLRIRLLHPQLFGDTAAPITLASETGNWTSLLHIDVRDAGGATVAWPLSWLNSPASTLRLDSSNLGELFWSLSPAQTLALAPGTYSLSVTWDSRTNAAPLAWSGQVRAVPVDVQVEPEPASLTSVQYEQKQRSLAEYNLALGNATEALNQIEALLQSDPNNIGGLSYKSIILRQLGRHEEALAMNQSALSQVSERYPDAIEPPRELLAQEVELTQLLLPGRLNSITTASDSVRLHWNVIAGEVYSVESSRDFVDWTIRATGLLAETNVLSWATNRLQDLEFFRIGQ